MKVAVMGAAGYGGQVLMRLLMEHPEVTQILPVSSSMAGSSLDLRDRGLGPDLQGKLVKGRIFLSRDEAEKQSPDAVFSALPPNVSAPFCQPFFGKSVLFDLSADFRLSNPQDHKNAYGEEAPYPEWRSKSAYGLPEIYRDSIIKADIIAVPGCYPTCTLLPLLPIASAGLVESPLIVNALSGISGAGRKAKEASLFVERSESAVPYNPGRMHRHVPEMQEHLIRAGSSATLFFTPHLVPMRRGMEVSTAFMVRGTVSGLSEKIGRILYQAYRDAPFIRLLKGPLPDTSDVLGSNRCDIAWRVSEAPEGQGMMLYLFSVIDNLVKGAAGQAVQNFNVRFGFEEISALPLRAMV